MKKLLVIGASGLLGSKAIELGKERYETHGTYAKNEREGLYKLDVSDKAAVFSLIEKIRPDIVMDTHGLNNVDYGESHQEEVWKVNVEGSKTVAEASQMVGAKYIFISSDYVFSGTKSIYTEKDKPDPVNYVGRAKWAVESLLEVLGINYIAARTSGLYGKSSSTGKKSFVQFVVENVQKGAKIDVINDQYSSPTLVDDIVQSLFALTETNATGVFNVVGRDCITKYDFARAICKEFKLDESLIIPCATANILQAAKRPVKVKMSTRKIKQLIKQTPVGVKKGLKIIRKG